MAEAANTSEHDNQPASSGNSSSNSNSTHTSTGSTTGSSVGLTVTVEAVKSNLTRPGDPIDVFCTLKVPRKLAYDWYKSSIVNYAACVNHSLNVRVLGIDNIALQDRLRTKISGQFGSNFASKKGGVRGRYLEGSFLFDVKRCDVFGSSQSPSQMAALQSSIEQLQSTVRAQEADIQQLNNEVRRTTDLLQSSAVVVNEGRLYSDVGERQKRRKVGLDTVNWLSYSIYIG